ncbi:TPA: hypoxanthine phosphoribosyltransferase [Candidatus Poribacteria bacterium]|nr:hypoxanthine phosphoribosyltransferase [Candidatus Poribacteria bacterium]
MDKSIKQILISTTQIKQRVKQLGIQLSADYKDKNLVIICVLKGAIVFLADLLRALSIPVELDFVRLSSYGKSAESSGVVQIIQNITSDIQHKDVLIVEDIVDTGTTLSSLKEALLSQKPSSLKTCALLNKPARRVKSITIEYVGFEIPNCFVVGYGLDYNEKYRNLPYIAVSDIDF